MASWIRALLTSTLLAFCTATPSAHAAPAPIVFDFEDGLKGWELHGSAQRVPTNWTTESFSVTKAIQTALRS